jgi:tetratricopeptide (TPR) repeat protein
LADYCEGVQIHYDPDYSYGENIAALEPTKTDRLSILRGYEALVKWIYASAAPWELPDRALARKRLEQLSAAEAQLRENLTTSGMRQLRSLLEESRVQSITAHGEHHRETLAITERLINSCLLNGGDLGRAIELLEELCQELPHQHERQRWRLLEAILRSTSAMRGGRQARDADRIVRAAVDTAVSAKGLVRDGDLEMLTAIAGNLRRDQMFNEASQLLRSVSEIYREVQGETHPDTLASLTDLAELLQSQGELTEARELLERVRNIRRRVLGQDQKETITIWSRALVPDKVRELFTPIMTKLDPTRKALSSVMDVVTVRPGYGYPDAGKPVPAIVVAVVPGTAPVGARELQGRFAVPFLVTDATVEEQLAKQPPDGMVSFSTPEGPTASTFETMLAGGEMIEFGPPKTGSYEELETTQLVPVEEKMDLTICVSPEAGWGELETFLAGTQKRLTVAMYQFTAPHIFQAVSDAVTPDGRKFELVLHPIPEKPPKSGVKANDLNEQDQVIDPLEKGLEDRFEIAWATLISKANPEGLWASATSKSPCVTAVRSGFRAATGSRPVSRTFIPLPTGRISYRPAFGANTTVTTTPSP